MGAAEEVEEARRAAEAAEAMAEEAEEARMAAEAAQSQRIAEEARKEAEQRAAEEVAEARKVTETAREVSIPKTEARVQASNGEILPSSQLKDSKQFVSNGVEAVRESEKAKAKDEAKKDEATKAAIEQAKSGAEETIGKIEAVLGRQDGASGDAANNNGTFVQLEMEHGNGGLLLENGGLQERAPRGFKKILKWFQCTVL